METNRGSEWIKWDLHVHTPCSLHQNYGGNSEEAWANFFKDLEALPKEFKVLGINDYIFLDGYRKVVEYKKSGGLPNIDLILPVIELRIQHFGNVSKDDPLSRVNLHIIFSDKLDADIIEAQFINAIQAHYYLTPEYSSGHWNGVINKDSLTDFGAKVKQTSPGETHGSDIAIGFNNLNFKEDKVFEVLNSHFFNNKYLTAIGKTEWDALRWDGSAAEKKSIINRVKLVFTATATVENFNRSKKKLKDQGVNDLLIDCSDAHSFSSSEDKDKIGNCLTWIKAEPTFDGLKQVLSEPTRIFVGETPPVLKRVKDYPTKFIESIEVTKIENSGVEDVWFTNFKISLNPELVAIIGNKGKGKSALSDILGLCGNAHIDEKDFSFLNKDKFRNPRPGLAKGFIGKINWQAGQPDTKNLDSVPDLDALEKVKYIPQSFLEKLCTTVDKKIFEEELEKVIFSRLEDHQKLGKGSLKEIINEQKQALESDVAQIKSNISAANTEIVELETKNSSQNRKSVTEALNGKTNELNVHEEKKPPAKDAPEENEETKKKTLEITTQIDQYREANKTTQEVKDNLNKERTTLALEITELAVLKQNLNSLSEYIKSFVASNSIILTKYGFEKKAVINYTVNSTDIDVALNKRRERVSEIEKIFANDNPENPDKILSTRDEKIKELYLKLEGASKEYQQHLTQMQEWQNQKTKIIGAIDKEGTLEYFKAQKDYLEKKIQEDIVKAYAKRIQLVEQLLQVKQSIANIYKELYKPVSDFITQHANELSDYNVQIDVALELNNFQDRFFNYVSNGASGSFHGTNEGRQVLNKLTEVIDFNNISLITPWLTNILDHIKEDKREAQTGALKRELKGQLKGGYKEKDFYDFLFSLDFYEPVYQLKLGLKNLNELSPGERGALLLIFYLLLDKRDIPIIIDQPEENLDNQSVYNILVHFIKKAKEKRQIIIVTHNPNLAVVCDAEQIIRMDIAKEDKNTVSMITGGIENNNINKAIVNVLEGTRPAFNNRTTKYEVSNPILN